MGMFKKLDKNDVLDFIDYLHDVDDSGSLLIEKDDKFYWLLDCIETYLVNQFEKKGVQNVIKK